MVTKNKRKLFYVLAMLGVILIPGIFSAEIKQVVAAASTQQTKAKAREVSYAQDRVLVRFYPGMAAKSKANIHAANGTKSLKEFKTVPGLQLVKLPANANVDQVLEQLRKNPNVVYAEPDYLHELQVTPNDTYFANMWGLHNNGTLSISGVPSVADADINAPEAWDVVSGNSNVVVAVIDTGVDYNHPDLINSMWVNPLETVNGIDDDGNGYIDDIYGLNAYDISVSGAGVATGGDPMDVDTHGTHVAGTIAASSNNNLGIKGVAQSAKIIGCRTGYNTTSGVKLSTAAAIICLDYLYDLKVNRGVNIVASNNSYGSYNSFSQASYDAIKRNMDAGILFVASAGNDTNNNDSASMTHYPDGYFLPNVISVASTDHTDNISSFSNYGRTGVLVGSPGSSIYSTLPSNSYGYKSGTSMASPHVTGLAALIKEYNTTYDWITIKNLILSSGTPLSALSSKTVTGRRIRAFDNNNRGALTCSNQTAAGVVWPRSTINVTIGGEVALGYLSINCDAPVDPGSVSISGPVSVYPVKLWDDGASGDMVANDGIYTASWIVPETTGTYTATFPNGQTVTVIVGNSAYTPYRQAISTSYVPKDLSAYTAYNVSTTGYLTFSGLPFSIKFGGSAGYTAVSIKGNGMISFQTPGNATDNSELPVSSFDSLVAPFWDYLNASATGGVKLVTSGTSPNREITVEWSAIPHNDIGGNASFQVVFFENSSDIVFNYIDTDFGSTAYNAGASATVGVQVDKDRATQFSYNTASVASNTSLLWRLDTGAPTAMAGNDQSVFASDVVNLSGAGADPDGGTLTYQWRQVGGANSVSISSANSANASFTAPSGADTLTFELAVTDDAGRVGRDVIVVDVSASPAVPGSITVTPSASMITSENGSSTTFSVVLDTQPTANVVLPVVSTDTTEGTVSPSSLTFTSSNWNTAQTVTVTGASDSVIDGNINYQVNVGPATSADTMYDAVTANSVTLTNYDTAGSGVIIAKTQSVMAEGGPSLTANISLKTAPTATVIIPVSSSDAGQMSVSVSSLSFTTANWSVPQSVTVTAVDDSTADGTQSVNLVLGAISSADPVYNGLNPQDSVFWVGDNDLAAVNIVNVGQKMFSENGGSVTFNVSLSSQPSGDVVLGFTNGDASEIALSTNTLTFTSTNWSTAQSLIINGVDDSITDGTQTVLLTTEAAVSADTAYNGFNPADITLWVTDNDKAGVIVSAPSSSAMSENGGIVTVSIVLTSEPTADVVIPIASSDTTEATVSTASLTFTTANWSTPQFITLTAVDDFEMDGNQVAVLQTGTISSADAGYNGQNPADKTVSVYDDDKVEILVSYTSAAVIGEGGVTSFELVLGSQPTADVTIGLSSSSGLASVSTASVSFTSGNWNVPQAVTLNSIADSVYQGNQAVVLQTAAATSADSVYNGLNPADRTIWILDDDKVEISVTATNSSVIWETGGITSFDIVLGSQPSADVSIGLTSSIPAQATVSTPSVTFTSANWSTPQTVTMNAVADLVSDGHQAVVLQTAAATSADTGYNGLNPLDRTVWVLDDDKIGINITPTTPRQTYENGAAVMYDITLGSQPSADVVIGVSSSDSGQMSASHSSLTFTNANWNVTQTVTLTPVDDAVPEAALPISFITAAATSADADYNGLDASDFVMWLFDND